MDIDGQVFIVTRGGPAIKLALVRVAAFRKVDIETHVRDIDSRLAGERAKADAEVSEASQSLQRAKRMSLVDSAAVLRLVHQPARSHPLPRSPPHQA